MTELIFWDPEAWTVMGNTLRNQHQQGKLV